MLAGLGSLWQDAVGQTTLTAHLVPGSIVLDVDRAGAVLYLHVLDVHTDAETAAYRATALEKMALSDVASAGYCFQIDLTRRALDRGLTVVEVPISFVEREIGDSKMNGDIVREAMVRVGQWGVKHRAAQLGRLLGWRPGESWHDLT